jgi:rod shape-determining protein MreD
MEQTKLTIALIISVALQWTLRNVAEPFAFIDFPLVIVVYAALQQRNSIRAVLFGAIAGLSVDALSSGLLGANGFSKTLIAYIVSEITRRVYVDNLLLRIPIIAGTCLLDDFVYYGMHRLFGQEPGVNPIVTMAYTLIGTTIAGTFIYIFLERIKSDNLRRRKSDFFPQRTRRQTRRRNPIRLGK